MELNTPVGKIPRIGSQYEKRLKNLGIYTVFDLLHHFPTRYLDLSQILPINELPKEGMVTIRGDIWQIRNIRTKTGKILTLSTINDSSGTIEAVWFNQPYLTRALKAGQKVNFSGKIEGFSGKLSLINPEYEVITERNNTETIHTGRIIPIYPETYGISSKWLRRQIKNLLDICIENIPDILFNKTIEQYNLLNYRDSLLNIHFPKDFKIAEQARRRLAFEELLLIQLLNIKRKKDWEEKSVSNPIKVEEKKLSSFISSLPFSLTQSQEKTLREILNDLSKEKSMNRLLQGDVGSGKTVVAAGAMYAAFLNKKRSVLMAPTEILAMQHYKTINSLLENHGVKVGILTSSKKNFEGSDIIIGTNALIHKKEGFEKIGLIVIDEQHRFGVEQRALLRSKNLSPHLLTMTATPIPRTIALTLYGDLDLSYISELPEGRKIIKTYVVPPIKRESAYGFIEKKIKEGGQAYIVCPFIEPSETLQTVKNALNEFESLKEKFKGIRLGLLHGKMKSKEKEDTLKNFKENKIQILVATPLVEVGIDVPNASIMVIEGSDRFGLATLHQLRGRVGRNENQSFCLLFSDTTNPAVIERLKALEKYHLGLDLAEIDFKTRGPGEIYGLNQSGMPNLKIASFNNVELIKETREAAENLLASDPSLKEFSPLLDTIEIKEATVTPD